MGTTPFTRTVIVGSRNSISAPSPQALGANAYQFTSWSDGGAASHNLTVPATATTYTATYSVAQNQGLVAAYGFEEGTGASTADSSGFGNTGALTDTAWNATGRYGKALTFNGTSSSVNVVDNNSLDLTNRMTLEAWVRPTTSAGWQTVLLKENPAQSDLVYALYGNDPAAGAAAYLRSGSATTSATNTTRLPLNTWTHVAATYDGSNIRLYQNGTLVTTKAFTGTMANSTGPLRIGGNSVWGEWFQGSIDEVRVYNRALSAAEIATDSTTPIASDAVPPSAPGTLTATGSLGGVTLSWGAATDNVGVVRYDVHRGTTPGFTPAAANRIAQPTTTTYQDNVAAGTYYYRVVAADAGGNVGPASNEATGTATADQPPSAPGTLSAVGGLGRVTLAWGAATDDVGVARYDVYRGTTPGFTPAAANRIAQPTTTTYQDNVAAGTYYYRVIAADTAGQSGAASNEATGTAAADQPPSAPGTLSATGSLGRVTLSWGAAADDVGVARYDVYRGGNPGFTPASANRIAQPATTTYQDNVAAGTYYYRVIAVDTTAQSGPASNEATGVSTADTTAPTVSVTSPLNGATVNGSVAVAANASDDVGVAGVQFRIDSTNLATEDTTSPYGATWDSRTVSNGVHTVTAVARDAAGNTATTSVAVTVNNAAPTGLVAAFGFNEGTGTATADTSGLANNGTATNTTWNAAGRFGQALTFNGTSSSVTVADSNSLDLASTLTVEAWVNPTVNTGWRTILLKENPARSDLAYGLYGSAQSAGAGGWVVTGSGYVTGAAENTTRLTAGTWTHVAMTYDGANIRLYQNGTLIATRARTGAIAATTGPLRIGGNSIWGEWFQGSIDEVRAYNRVLTAAEITTDSNTAI